MARKFVLVPSDQFHHLLAAHKQVEDPEPLMQHTKKEISRILKNPKLNISKKRALFDQEVNRLIKQRKEKINRPIRVHVVNEQMQPPSLPIEQPAMIERKRGEREMIKEQI